MRNAALILLGLWAGLSPAAIELSFESTEHIPARHLPFIEQALQRAMREVRENGPTRGNPFRSRVTRKVHVVLTSNRDPYVAEVYAKTAESTPTSLNSDAFTFTAAINRGGPQLATYIFLLVDDIVWDPETGQQRPDAYIRMLTALGHEVYGNVPIQLKLRLGHPPPPATFEERQQEEVAAFSAGIAFLERYQESEGAKDFKKEHIAEALKREKAALESWLRPTCPDELAKKRKKRR